jgi:hypothetical protein
MEHQQLLTEGEVLQDEIFSGVESFQQPAEKVSKARKHDRNLT